MPSHPPSLDMPSKLGYFNSQGIPQGCRNTPAYQFSGGVVVPENVTADQLYNFLKDDVFENPDITAIKTTQDLETKCNGMISLKFGGGSNDKWVKTRESIKSGLKNQKLWLKDEVMEWVARRKSEENGARSSSGTSQPKLSPSPTSAKDSMLDTTEPQVSRDAGAGGGVSDTAEIKFGARGPQIILTDQVAEQLIGEGDQVLLAKTLSLLLPKIAEENLKLNSSLTDANKKIVDLDRDLMNANMSKILDARPPARNDDQEAVENCQKQIHSLDVKLSSMMKKISSKMDTLAISSSQPFRGEWAKQVASLPTPLVVFASKDTVSSLQSSPSLSGDLEALRKEGLFIATTLPRPNFKELLAEIKFPTQWAGRQAVFFLEYEAGQSTGHKDLDLMEAETIKTWAFKLFKLATPSFPTIVIISLPTQENHDLAKLVEAALSSLDPKFHIIALNTNLIESSTLCPITVGMGMAIKILSGKDTEDPCKECSLFCPDSNCLAKKQAPKESERKEDMIKEEDVKSERKKHENFTIPKVANPTLKRRNEDRDRICNVCGSFTSNHIPPDTFCVKPESRCSVCSSTGHYPSAHNVGQRFAREMMKNRWGADFYFTGPNPQSGGKKGKYNN